MIYIPIGDHCAGAICLKQAGMRSASYPFDWVVTSHSNKLMHSNFGWIVHTFMHMLDHPDDIHAFVTDLFISPLFDAKTKVHYGVEVWFPHDNFGASDNFGTPDNIRETIEKYVRRYKRLIEVTTSNVHITYLLVTRGYGVERAQLMTLINKIHAVNNKARFLWISGEKETTCENVHPTMLSIHTVKLPEGYDDVHQQNEARRPHIVSVLQKHISLIYNK